MGRKFDGWAERIKQEVEDNLESQLGPISLESWTEMLKTAEKTENGGPGKPLAAAVLWIGSEPSLFLETGEHLWGLLQRKNQHNNPVTRDPINPYNIVLIWDATLDPN